MNSARGFALDHLGPVDWPYEPFPHSALDGSILDRFDLIVRRHAGRLAVQDSAERLTYQELAARLDRVAGAVHAAVQGRPGPVVVLLPNDARLPTALLGVLAAGRAFAPLDVDHPLERNRLIADQAGAAAILSTGEDAGELRARLGHDTPLIDVEAAMAAPGSRPEVRLGPDDLAYILYTSGSTGAPKGVCHSHRNCLYDSLVVANNVHLTCEDRLSLFYASVIAALKRTFSALLSGASLHIMPPGDRSAAELAREVRARRITYMHEVPTLFRRIAGALEPGERLDSLRVLRLSGDRSDWSDFDLFKRACPPDAYFGVNLGCTEAPSTYAHWYVDEAVREPGGRLPVGRDMEGVSVEVVDPEGRPVADGEIGEFRLASRYLSQGYWNAPELTAATFSRRAEDPEIKVYTTGDMGFRRPDGLLEFVGRKDQMIKLRGHRIEPAEVESVLRACRGVADAAVIVRRSGEGAPRAMVAYVELESGFQGLLPRHLMAMLSQVLPAYLLPSVIFVVEALPRLVNFKVDRPRLARIDADRAEHDPGRATNPVLDGVALAMESVVPGARATAEDNLLSLGGDSLQAVELAIELERKFGFAVPTRVIHQSQCIRELSDWICAHQKRAAARSRKAGINA